MKESTKEQHKKDVENFNQVRAQSIEDNKEFYEFLHTKGLKAKVKLVIENIKQGARESREKTKQQIENSKKGIYGHNSISAERLTKEFNEFLKIKGLQTKYTVTIEEVK